MSANERFRLPSGIIAVRADAPDGRFYSVHGLPAVLTVADIEALYADSIAADGGRVALCGCGVCVCGHVPDTHGEEGDCRLCGCGLYRQAVRI